MQQISILVEADLDLRVVDDERQQQIHERAAANRRVRASAAKTGTATTAGKRTSNGQFSRMMGTTTVRKSEGPKGSRTPNPPAVLALVPSSPATMAAALPRSAR